mmetsp:Transcript_9231/g.25887  ORF Transcript_9231/g.25887 Transcript_9231/m.25887 type:complete len:222 (+) Transcript_9231:143-808(+)|eukprot:CAMPEP_0119131880 /NCGR_PEP_ID=MMETSP1310-20130426/10835_1 /TAXON_ID=464262 /ORGANISM="Genus nov. species nov., Strain RCC2339" /LENGTH=221 /DNA_ID=CAMNT_0007122477 /DNA_START=79 /DNA_END=744 /DNA_ORIENTATION=+
MATKPTIKYFPIRGRVETARLLLELAGVEYDDQRITFEQWAAIKPTTPLGQVPLYSDDDVTDLPQSMAIATHVAEKFNLAGKTASERAWAKVVMHASDSDVFNGIAKIIFNGKSHEENKDAVDAAVDNLAGQLEKLLKLNNGGKGFYVGDSPTLADAASYHVSYNLLRALSPDVFAKHELLAAHTQRFGDLPQIAAYIKERRPALTLPGHFAYLSSEEVCK